MQVGVNFQSVNSISFKSSPRGDANDVHTIARILRDKYGVEAYLDPAAKEPAQDLLETVQNVVKLGFNPPDRVYTLVGKFVEDHPTQMEGVGNLHGTYRISTKSVMAKPDTQRRAEYNLGHVRGIYACEKPASHEVAHHIVESEIINDPLLRLAEHETRLTHNEALQAYYGLSTHAAIDSKGPVLQPQNAVEYNAELFGSLLEGNDPSPDLLQVHNNLTNRFGRKAVEQAWSVY